MAESNIEKKRDGQADLEAKHADEIQALWKKQDSLISDLEIRHAQEIQKLEARSIQREKEFLNDCQEEYRQQAKSLVSALLKVRFERDRLLLAVSWMAVGTLVFSAFRGFIHGALSKGLALVALAGFIGAITSVGRSLRRNRGHLQCIKEGIPDTNSIVEELEWPALRLLIFGLISMFFLGLSLFIHTPAKVAVVVPTTGVLEQKPVVVPLPQTTSAVNTPVVENTSKPSSESQQSTSTRKTSGNGGNFVGGSAQK
jgi:hypothetical protein